MDKLAVLLVFGLCVTGCGGNSAPSTAPSTPVPAPPAARNARLDISCGCFVTVGGVTKTVRFAPTPIGGSGVQALTFSNLGTDTLTVGALGIRGLEGDGSTAFSPSPTAFALAPGHTQTVTVTFRPQHTYVGLAYDSANLTVTSDSTGGDAGVGLLGCHTYCSTCGC